LACLESSASPVCAFVSGCSPSNTPRVVPGTHRLVLRGKRGYPFSRVGWMARPAGPGRPGALPTDFVLIHPRLGSERAAHVARSRPQLHSKVSRHGCRSRDQIKAGCGRADSFLSVVATPIRCCIQSESCPAATLHSQASRGRPSRLPYRGMPFCIPRGNTVQRVIAMGDLGGSASPGLTTVLQRAATVADFGEDRVIYPR
jgi:hypothetical protein